MLERISHLRPNQPNWRIPRWLVVKNSAGENGKPLQCSCLENPMGRRASFFTSVSVSLKKGHNWNFGDLQDTDSELRRPKMTLCFTSQRRGLRRPYNQQDFSSDYLTVGSLVPQTHTVVIYPVVEIETFSVATALFL